MWQKREHRAAHVMYLVKKRRHPGAAPEKPGTHGGGRTMLRVLFFGLPVLVFAVGLPLALRWVPPNRFYGFRTSTTLLSLDAWYRINFATGVALSVAGALGGVVAVLLGQGMVVLKPEVRYLVGVLLSGLLLLASLVPVVFYANRF
ncbi:MAG TPA: SdpI family protein [Acetobacteraceae bacterium]|jgi:hypothetical protein|nr:SdpI family protein [Acetobacteraceae bacterium]